MIWRWWGVILSLFFLIAPVLFGGALCWNGIEGVQNNGTTYGIESVVLGDTGLQFLFFLSVLPIGMEGGSR
jgi:hypothetical protein